MAILVSGLAIFFATHLFSAFRSRRPGHDIVGKIGKGPYMGLYSLFAGAGLVLIIWGYGAARPSPILYTPPPGLAHLNLLLMAVSMVLLASAYLPVGRIRKFVRHPMLAAVKIWAFGHLLANGELNSVLLFASFLAYGIIDRIAVKKRGDTGPGPEVAASLAGDLASLAIGLGAYVAILFWLHPLLIGMPALPG